MHWGEYNQCMEGVRCTGDIISALGYIVICGITCALGVFDNNTDTSPVTDDIPSIH